MSKFNVKDWAAFSEIIASIGVIFSLAFLAYSVQRNNEYLQATTDNLMYEMLNDVYKDRVENPDVAAIFIKRIKGEQLTEIEQVRQNWHLWRHMNIWELAYDRHQEGLLSDDKWAAWDKSFVEELLNPIYGFPPDVLNDLDDTLGSEFSKHVIASYEALL